MVRVEIMGRLRENQGPVECDWGWSIGYGGRAEAAAMITFVRITGADCTRITTVVRCDDEIRVFTVTVGVQGAGEIADRLVHHQIGGTIV